MLVRASMLVGRSWRIRRRIREGSSRRDGRRLIDALLRRRVMDRPSASIRATTVVNTTPLPVRLDYRLPRSLAKPEIARLARHHRPNGGTYACPFLFPSLLGGTIAPVPHFPSFLCGGRTPLHCRSTDSSNLMARRRLLSNCFAPVPSFD